METHSFVGFISEGKQTVLNKNVVSCSCIVKGTTSMNDIMDEDEDDSDSSGEDDDEEDDETIVNE